MPHSPRFTDSNRLIESLAAICAERLFEEKWLIAPNLRLAHQWLEVVTFAGQPVLNARVVSLYKLAQRIAAPALSDLGKKPVGSHSLLVVLDRVWREAAQKENPYLAALHPSWALFQSLGQAVGALRMAGVTSADLTGRPFEQPRKGREIRSLLSAYETELERLGWADQAEIYRIATEAIKSDPKVLGEESFFLFPEDLELAGKEESFLAALPESQKVRLEVDPPWLGNVDENGDILSLDFFRSVGEVNEVREALRRILSSGVLFDQVELLHTNRETYVPLIYEIREALAAESEREAPVTFEEGIPVVFSRPGKSFSLWLRWITEGHPQALFVEMIQEGWIRLVGFESQARLADALRTVRIGFGLDRYPTKIQETLEAWRRRRKVPIPDHEDEGPAEDRGEEASEAAAQALIVAQESLTSLFELSKAPTPEESPGAILHRARCFLSEYANASGQDEEYAVKALNDKIEQFQTALGERIEPLQVDLWEWLADLPHSVHILGSRPRPGHLHVAPLALGGHSGRPYTFILGLDDGRFPGSNLQDPILLDSERRKISGLLPTSAERFEKKIEDYWRLLGRLRGAATLSFSARDVVEDRDAFPSPLLVETHRRYTGDRDEDMSGFLAALPPPVSFAPSEVEQSLDDRDWRLVHLTAPGGYRDPSRLIQELHPHLAVGRAAQLNRDSEEFSKYDGRLSGELWESRERPLSPFSAESAPLSATALEELGRCPLAYYFRRILGIAPPEDLGRDPGVWLTALEAGSLLHEVFRRFVENLIRADEKASFAKHEAELFKILETEIATFRELAPPPNEGAFARQVEEFQFAARVFLKEEESVADQRRPSQVEMGFGMEGGACSPVNIDLGENETIRLRGRIDRIDRNSKGNLLLWDYKTGSPRKYREKPPFNQGRIVQPYLYWAAAQRLLQQDKEETEPVESFGYFFPTSKGMTDRIVYRAEQLEEGREIVRNLCRLIERGAFLHTNKIEDCAFCDFKPVCGDLDRAAGNSSTKLGNAANEILEPLRNLRGIDAD